MYLKKFYVITINYKPAKIDRHNKMFQQETEKHSLRLKVDHELEQFFH